MVKSEKEIQKMRVACQIVASAHKHIESYIKAGVTTEELDEILEKFIISQGAKPNFKGYRKYPKTACISVNDVVVHGIPSEKIILADGDIVSIDVGAVKDGYHGDAARTYAVGEITKEKQKLINVTKECFFKGMTEARAGRRVGDIGCAIQRHAESNGYSVVRSLTGHGIGKKLHEDPSIPNFGKAGTGTLLKNGMTLAIEPMINEGTFHVIFENDGWTCRTKDGKMSAHYEETILVTNGDAEILTKINE
ncbi:MAG: type I methionyl aminopeptidase [Firmicutes bacterium]|nr:type I methionyl aminopeptidase [Bacillota bacterium]